MSLRHLQLEKECELKAVRSGGAGGQHVNKVSSRMELTFSIPNSLLLDDAQKNILQEKLASRLTTDGVLRVTEDSDRSQHVNREKIIEKFYLLLEKALAPVKKRKKTKVSKAAKAKRLEKKRKHSEKKQNRRSINNE
ncbi:MAG TPA: alternative ribosome rescue aminoacyl-tRNA hydrolase ArfB [Bacteroidia bacterium]|nr:alternative ribosome rescue aminoacyl-tRNA hydrolase ArfB [Bacteroidia bacterium]